jgi:hypothetical protein
MSISVITGRNYACIIQKGQPPPPRIAGSVDRQYRRQSALHPLSAHLALSRKCFATRVRGNSVRSEPPSNGRFRLDQGEARGCPGTAALGQHSPLRGAWSTGRCAPIPDARRNGVPLRSSTDSGPSSRRAHRQRCAHKRTCHCRRAGPKVPWQTNAPQQRWRSPSLDDLVGAGEHRGRNFEAETSFQVSNANY